MSDNTSHLTPHGRPNLANLLDLVALGTTLLLDTSFVRSAQAYEQYRASDLKSVGIPQQYMAAISHLYPYKGGERKAVEGMKKALKPVTHKK